MCATLCEHDIKILLDNSTLLPFGNYVKLWTFVKPYATSLNKARDLEIPAAVSAKNRDT